MRTAVVTLKGVSPFSQSKHYLPQKTSDKEPPEKVEARTWRERCHVNSDGNLFIPPMCFKLSLEAAAQYRQQRVPGKGQSTYTKHFRSGVLVVEPLVLPIQKDDVEGEWLFVPSDGKRGGAKRVSKCFPLIKEWGGEVEFLLLDDTITEEVFEDTLTDAGKYIGIGRFRPANGGFYGRYSVEKIRWSNGANGG